MAGSPKKRARRVAAAKAAGLLPEVPESAPPALRKGARPTKPSEPIPASPRDGAGAVDTTLTPSGPGTKEAPPWLKEAAERIEAAEAKEREVIDRLAKCVAIPTGGGPTEYHPAHCEAVVELGSIGMEVVEIAVRFGVLKHTLYDWAKQHPDFARAFARAREGCEAYHTALIREQMARPSMAGNATAYMSYMARRFRGDWREVKEVEHNVTVSHEDRLERRMRVISERRKVIDVSPEAESA